MQEEIKPYLTTTVTKAVSLNLTLDSNGTVMLILLINLGNRHKIDHLEKNTVHHWNDKS